MQSGIRIITGDEGDERMKALVLAGGFPQIALIQELKKRNIEVVLADYNAEPVAKPYADKYYQESTLDVLKIKEIAVSEAVDFLITVCTDQALLTVAKVSEELGLPCYIDYKTALNVTNKQYMKDVFMRHGIPTSKYVILREFDEEKIKGFRYPLIVKPVDCNSSKGVRRCDNIEELKEFFNEAVKMSRTDTAIIEEFVAGKELSVDVYVENGEAKLLDITTSEKIKDKDKFVIFRTWHPARISETVVEKIQDAVQKIADAFVIKNAPMLVQLLADGDDIYVIEFSARTGGGVKHISIERRAGVDIVAATVDVTLFGKSDVVVKMPKNKYMVDEYIYCRQGVYDHIEGSDHLLEQHIISDFYSFKWRGAEFETIKNSGDRVAGFSIEGDTFDELKEKHDQCNAVLKVVDINGSDMMRHDLLEPFDIEES